MYRVLRQIPTTNGAVLKVGDLVDASNWKNRHSLIMTGRLEACDAPVMTSGYVQTIGDTPVGENVSYEMTVSSTPATPAKKRGRPRKEN